MIAFFMFLPPTVLKDNPLIILNNFLKEQTSILVIFESPL